MWNFTFRGQEPALTLSSEILLEAPSAVLGVGSDAEIKILIRSSLLPVRVPLFGLILIWPNVHELTLDS